MDGTNVKEHHVVLDCQITYIFKYA